MDLNITTTTLITATIIATTTLLIIARSAIRLSRPSIIPSPLQKVLLEKARPSHHHHHHHQQQELKQLVYQPDQFPGARDVPSPYGSIRVYEFGPEDGDKILLIHGISTSCITFCEIAKGLADRGCRVMLFDLFGRGFSDGVGDLPHDHRLYVSQILLALASSPLAWTGSASRLKVIGYSLGGGIAVHLANALPHLVHSLVLLAPAGFISTQKFGRLNRLMVRSGLFPERLVAFIAKKRLQRPIGSKTRKLSTAAQAVEMAAAEAADPLDGEKATHLEQQIMAYVRWMVMNHDGFVPAFMSCLRYAPLLDQSESWKQLSNRKDGSTHVLLAQNDELIDQETYTRDALPLIGGPERVSWKILPGGHDFVMTHAPEILRELDECWGYSQ